MRKFVVFCMMVMVGSMACADEIPTFTYFEETGEFKVELNDYKLVALVVPTQVAATSYVTDLPSEQSPVLDENGDPVPGQFQYADPRVFQTTGSFAHFRNWVFAESFEGTAQLALTSGPFLGAQASHTEDLDNLLRFPPGLAADNFAGQLEYGNVGGAVGLTDVIYVPVPEPSVIVLLSCGALGLLVTAIRRRRS